MADVSAIQAVIRQKLEDVKRQDYFGVLGVAADAPPATVQTAYFNLAKQLHPDRLIKSGLSEEESIDARRVFEFITEAFRVLSDPAKREEVARAHRAGLANPFANANSAARLEAEEAKIFFHKGKKMLKMRAWDQAELFLRKAVEKLPGNAEFLSSLGWAIFNNAERDEAVRMEEAKRLWQQALDLDKRSPRTLYYLSLYYKAKGEQGRQRQLLESALDLEPSMIEAQREVRLLEMRAGKGRPANKGRGLLEAIFPSLVAARRKRR